MANYSTLRTKHCLAAICFVLSVFVFAPANAQHSRGMNADGDILSGSRHSSGGGGTIEDGWLLAFNGGYESPTGEVKDSYQGSPTFGVSVLRRMGNVLYSATIDYRSYKPLHDTLAVTPDGINYFNAKFTHFSGVGLYLGLAYELPLASNVSVYGGVNGGYVLISYKVSIDDPLYSSSEEVSNGQSTYVAPKIGLNFMLTPKLGLMLEGRYSLGVVGGSYNSRTGSDIQKGFGSYAGNVFLTYSF